MGQAVIVGSAISTQAVGSTTTTNPVIVMSLGGTIISGGYQSFISGGSSRMIYPSVDSSGNIKLTAFDIIFGTAIPEQTFNAKVWAAG